MKIKKLFNSEFNYKNKSSDLLHNQKKSNI